MNSVHGILQAHLEVVKQKITSAMAAHKRNASGRSVASLNVQSQDFIGALWGSKSFWAMERGRKGGKVPYKFIDIIKQWIVDKGISVKPIPAKRASAKHSPYERGLNSFAGAVAYTIMKKGTKLHRDHGYNDIYTTAINEELEAMAKEYIFISKEQIGKINDTIK